MSKKSEYISYITSAFVDFFAPYKFGFVRGHYYLNDNQVNQLWEILQGNEHDDIVRSYENRFAQLIGSGYGISFAAGRMAFYCLLKSLQIGPGDEIILLGFTCSVMVNAVLRTGAKPVFTDVDPETFGSNPSEINKKMTPRTKAVVAQHSFGIPCSIQEIVDLCKSQGILLIEDCAITLDSKINGIAVGNFGDAAIFSTDHSKPLNTMIGGFLYSRDEDVIKRVKFTFPNIPSLNHQHQKRLYARISFEKKWYYPSRYQHMKLSVLPQDILRKFNKTNIFPIFLESDSSRPATSQSAYPYPAKLPAFLAQLGIWELERWGAEKSRRKAILRKYLAFCKGTPIESNVPAIYFASSIEIVPLRFVYVCPYAAKQQNVMSKYIDVEWIWFKQPIIGCRPGPEVLGYVWGDCDSSEAIGPAMINWPCVVPEQWEELLLRIYQQVITSEKDSERKVKDENEQSFLE